MRSSSSLTRRLVPAIAVTVVATLVFGAVVVTADVATDDTPLLPPWFGVAAPLQGDAWRYNVTLAGDWTFGLDDQVDTDEALPFATYQWAGPGTVRGGDGRMHDVNRLFTETLHYQPARLYQADEEASTPAAPIPGQGHDGSNITLTAGEDPYWGLVDASGWILAGGRTVASRGLVDAEQSNYTNYGFSQGPADLGLGAYYEKRFSAYGAIEFPDAEVPCLVFNALQGANQSTDQGLVLFDACQLGGAFLDVPAGLVFHAAALDTVQGVQTVRYDARHNGTYQAWFTPAVPYPVRVAVSLPSLRPAILEEGDLDAPGARSAVLEMVGFAAGNATLDLVDDPADTDAAPALVLAKPQAHAATGVRLGPDESGVTHPFPLSLAFQQALDAPNFASIDTYLAGKSGVYVAAAEYFEDGRAQVAPGSNFFGHTRTWLVALSNGDETFEFSASQQTFETTLPMALRDSARQPVYGFQQGPGPYYDNDLLRLSEVPDTLATARSLADRWAVFDGSGLEANAFGFAIGCAERESADEACRVEVRYDVGHRRTNQNSFLATPGSSPFVMPGNPYGTEQHVWVERTIAFDGDGTASSMQVMDDRSYRSATNGTLPSDTPIPPAFAQSSDPGYAVQSTAVNGIPSSATQWIPEPEQAASIGFMGLVVGFLYWVWPKLGIMGLFSRLERGELLDHPARAKLVQIVESQPGIHFHDLAQKAELANGTAVHHLRKLSDSGHLSVRRTGRYTCYFPGGRVDPHQAAAAPLLKSDGARQVLEAVRAKPGMSNLEVAQATGLQPSTVNYHVQRLSQAGLVAALRDGRMVRLHPGLRMGSATGTDGPAAGAAA